MPVLNTIKQFISKREISRYRFWQETGLKRDTAYRVCNDQTYIPTGNVLAKICATYNVQPGDLLTWIPDDDISQDATILINKEKGSKYTGLLIGLEISVMDMKQLRERANLRTVDVASIVGIGESSVRNREKGRTVPQLKINQIAALCRLYKCSIEELEQAVEESMAIAHQNEESDQPE